MIFKRLPSLRPEQVCVPTPITVVTSGKFDTAKFTEAKRRDEIVRKLVKDCPYSVGETVEVNSDPGKEKYGATALVMGIAQNYIQLGKEEWPEGDNPLIVHARADDDTEFFCTVNYLRPIINKAC